MLLLTMPMLIGKAVRTLFQLCVSVHVRVCVRVCAYVCVCVCLSVCLLHAHARTRSHTHTLSLSRFLLATDGSGGVMQEQAEAVLQRLGAEEGETCVSFEKVGQSAATTRSIPHCNIAPAPLALYHSQDTSASCFRRVLSLPWHSKGWMRLCLGCWYPPTQQAALSVLNKRLSPAATAL